MTGSAGKSALRPSRATFHAEPAPELDQAALAAYLEAAAGRPAQFGGLDCVRFVVEAVSAGWRIDLRDRLGYRDRASAIARLRAAGGLYEAICAELGAPRPAAELEAGAMAWLPGPHDLVGLVMPGYVAVKHRRAILRGDPELVLEGWMLWAPR